MLLDIIQDRTQNMNNVDLNFNWLITLLGTIGFLLITYFVKSMYEEHKKSHKDTDEKILHLENKTIDLENKINALDSKSGANFKHIENKIDKNSEIFLAKLEAKFETFENKLEFLKELMQNNRQPKQ